MRLSLAERKARWASYSPRKKWLVMSQYPDELEQDLNVRGDVRFALEEAFGRYLMPPPDVAEVPWLLRPFAEDGPAMTWGEIGAALGISAARARQVAIVAMQKLWVHQRRLLAELGGEPWTG